MQQGVDIAGEIEKFIIRQPPMGEKMIMMVKTPGSQMGSPVAAEEGGGGRWEVREWREK